ncbi:MAG: TonB-dependent receptor [Deltaproteobacteria bacterium]|nr:TonB-dependent receptor [Deltaproteobacteria bacterium]
MASRTEENWYKRDNLEEVKIHRAELELKWTATDWLSLFANYTYNSTRIKKDPVNPENEGNLINNYPKHKARAGVMSADPRILDVNLRNVDEITSPTMHHSFRPPSSDLESQKS